MKGRYQMPELVRFLRPDPMRDWVWENPHTLNLYEYVGNNPINGWDPTGLWSFREAWNTFKSLWNGNNASQNAQGAAISVGAQATTDAAARTLYNQMTAPLKDAPKGDLAASAARTTAKEVARAASSPAGAYIAETMRPMAQEVARVGGSAGKTNAAVNTAMGVAGKAGPVLLVAGAGMSVYNVATAPEDQKFRVAAGESGAWAGALAFGTVFAKGGAAIGARIGVNFFGVGAVPGAAIGGVLGGVFGGAAGALTGHKAATNIYDAVNN